MEDIPMKKLQKQAILESMNKDKFKFNFTDEVE